MPVEIVLCKRRNVVSLKLAEQLHKELGEVIKELKKKKK